MRGVRDGTCCLDIWRLCMRLGLDTRKSHTSELEYSDDLSISPDIFFKKFQRASPRNDSS